jgi:hypothetical protein
MRLRRARGASMHTSSSLLCLQLECFAENQLISIVPNFSLDQSGMLYCIPVSQSMHAWRGVPSLTLPLACGAWACEACPATLSLPSTPLPGKLRAL